MRAYFFGNMYLSSIQQGIQAGHVIGDMFTKYMGDNYDQERLSFVADWARDHKTMILLNAGYGANIHALNKMFSSDYNPYPFAMFCEETAALDGAATSVGIILPEHIYMGASILRNGRPGDDNVYEIDKGECVSWRDDDNKLNAVSINTWERDLMYELNQYRLAS